MEIVTLKSVCSLSHRIFSIFFWLSVNSKVISQNYCILQLLKSSNLLKNLSRARDSLIFIYIVPSKGPDQHEHMCMLIWACAGLHSDGPVLAYNSSLQTTYLIIKCRTVNVESFHSKFVLGIKLRQVHHVTSWPGIGFCMDLWVVDLENTK